jgi:hypothetical protein
MTAHSDTAHRGQYGDGDIVEEEGPTAVPSRVPSFGSEKMMSMPASPSQPILERRSAWRAVLVVLTVTMAMVVNVSNSLLSIRDVFNSFKDWQCDCCINISAHDGTRMALRGSRATVAGSGVPLEFCECYCLILVSKLM